MNGRGIPKTQGGSTRKLFILFIIIIIIGRKRRQVYKLTYGTPQSSHETKETDILAGFRAYSSIWSSTKCNTFFWIFQRKTFIFRQSFLMDFKAQNPLVTRNL